jgi:hypothetical protein
MRERQEIAFAQPPPFHNGPPPQETGGLWIMCFNMGQPNEGVYTQAAKEVNWVLAFECTDDAAQFAQELVAKGFDLATPDFWGADRLANFCRTTGIQVWEVPKGTMPPSPDNTFDQKRDTVNHASEPQPQRPHNHFDNHLANRDPYVTYRLWLDQLLVMPDECGDDDCTIR